jgi:hypothetical protein
MTENDIKLGMILENGGRTALVSLKTLDFIAHKTLQKKNLLDFNDGDLVYAVSLLTMATTLLVGVAVKCNEGEAVCHHVQPNQPEKPPAATSQASDSIPVTQE